jgi:hypothetical protein
MLGDAPHWLVLRTMSAAAAGSSLQGSNVGADPKALEDLSVPFNVGESFFFIFRHLLLLDPGLIHSVPGVSEPVRCSCNHALAAGILLLGRWTRARGGAVFDALIVQTAQRTSQDGGIA